jgi:Mg2+/Co2+ transporter CorC
LPRLQAALYVNQISFAQVFLTDLCGLVTHHNVVPFRIGDFFTGLAIGVRFIGSDGESETIAGFVLEISGRFPKRGEKIGFEGFNFTVESIDKKRLKQIKVTLPHEA